MPEQAVWRAAFEFFRLYGNRKIGLCDGGMTCDRTSGVLETRMRRVVRRWHLVLSTLALPVASAAQTPAAAPPPMVSPTVTGLSPNATGPVAPNTDGKQLEEIVVTAQKRRENARKIPGSIGVIGGAELIEHHIENYEDITRTVPGVSFAANNGPGQDNISIRGISSTVGNPTVGVYLDEVPIITVQGFVGQSQPRLFDLDRVEVLRGPQGTLYGASSEGGTIRFITTQPDLQNYSAYVRTDVSGTVHGGPNTEEQGAVNIPIVPGKVALRVAADYNYTSGYIDTFNPITFAKEKDGTNYERGGVFRATLKMQIDPDVYRSARHLQGRQVRARVDRRHALHPEPDDQEGPGLCRGDIGDRLLYARHRPPGRRHGVQQCGNRRLFSRYRRHAALFGSHRAEQ
jgi:outer membrane receptor protein involved in Fe transport